MQQGRFTGPSVPNVLKAELPPQKADNSKG